MTKKEKKILVYHKYKHEMDQLTKNCQQRIIRKSGKIGQKIHLRTTGLEWNGEAVAYSIPSKQLRKKIDAAD